MRIQPAEIHLPGWSMSRFSVCQVSVTIKGTVDLFNAYRDNV